MYLAIREMRFAKGRYALIATIMVLVSFLVLFVTGLAQGLSYDNAASIKNMAATHFVLEQDSNHRFTRSQVGQKELDEARAVVGQDNAEPLGVRMTTVSPADDSKKIDVTLFMVNPGSWLAPTVTEGKAINEQSAGEVVVDQKLAKSGVTIGTVLVDQASGTEWTVSGFVQNESFSHAPVVFLNEKEWLALQAGSRTMEAASAAGGAGTEDKSTEANAGSGNESGTSTEAVIGTGASSGAERTPVYNAIAVKGPEDQVSNLTAVLSKTEIITKSDAVSAIPGYKEEQGSLLMMIAFLYVISAFVLAVFFYVITIQKTSQFGILKAIGTRNGYLAGSVSLQVLLLSVGSLVISVLLVQLFESVLPASMPFQLGVSTLALTCVLFILMSMAGSLFSVWKVTKIDALDAIGRTAA
ncbi:ABC transporter permease [Paenibacillus barcinonensis]|uniref:Putative hemin transport system permease protein HrtB n=1 Tax=Paenibacillus barcinonensis TaxID=198119 RepID=A0A2V4W9J7_PAEBA|nr:ABC transporter permease [Paenibacillus barcinonensis]PYE47827.1 putative ABC transport system permease protein [Paenibacillus barcinonensis]QKS59074.1 ABC transporter permease [Paenibacillus barcinonensis]